MNMFTNEFTNPLEEARQLLERALQLMDEARPYSIPAARLQQVIDEWDHHFAR